MAVSMLSLAVLIALLTGTIVSLSFAIDAKRGQEMAQQNLQLAEQAVETYLTRITEDTRLNEDDFHELRTDLLKTAIPFYEQFANQSPGDAESEANRANAYSRLAALYSQAGLRDDAMNALENAVAIQIQLVDENPHVAQYQYELAENYKLMAWSLRQAEDRVKALDHYGKALNLLAQLLQDFPDEPTYLHALVTIHIGMGMCIDSDLSHYEQAVSIGNTLVAKSPRVSKYQAELASAHNQLGNRTRDQVAALNHLTAAVEIRKQLVNDFPNQPFYRSGLADTLYNLAELSGRGNRIEAARQYYEAAITLCNENIEKYPSLEGNWIILANLIHSFGDFLYQQNEQATARIQYVRAKEIYQKLAGKGLGYKARMAQLSNGLHNTTQLRRRCESALSSNPDNISILNQLAWLLATTPALDIRDGKRAVELSTKACELTDFGEPQYLDTLAAAYAELGDFDSAVEWSKRAVELVDDDESKTVKLQLNNALKDYMEHKSYMSQKLQPDENAKE